MRRWLFLALGAAAGLLALRLYLAPLEAVPVPAAAVSVPLPAAVPVPHNSTLAPAPAASPPAPAELTRARYEAGHPWPRPGLCPALGRDLQLLVLVASAPAHSAARAAIRRTWGHYAHRRGVALAFFLGRPGEPGPAESALEAEDRQYGDVVRGAFRDSYDNLTLKTLSMLEWTAAYCPRAARLLKADDDVFVNVPALLAAAAEWRAPGVWGRVLRGAAPVRAPGSKYFLPRSQFPGRRLPAFATGPAYVVSRAAVPRLLAAALGLRWLRLEDVQVTGLAAAAAGVARRAHPGFHNRRWLPAACRLRAVFSLHMVRPHEQFELWRRLEDGRARCGNRTGQ